MKRLAILTVALLVVLVATGRGLVPETISYQGVLTDGAGTPVADGSYAITFKIYTIASGGTEIWTETQTVNVAGGIFSVILGSLNPLGIPFDAKYWLGVAVDGGAEFTPRREMTATAYSLNARGVADSAITAGDIAGGTVVRSLNALTDDVTLAAGTNVSIATSGDSLIISASGGGSGGWSLTGNSGTDSGTNFLGTTDAEGLQLRVDNTTALRIEPGAVPSIIGGDATNTILSGPEGAVIAGGGNATDPNQVTDDYGVVGGGRGNTVGDEDADATTATDAVVGGGLLNQAMARGSVIGGGETNEASGEYSTIGGGLDNFTTAHAATVAGGDGNVASGLLASIAGGNANQAQGWESAVGGGGSNVASGYDATVPGGRENTAAGGYSLAAGRRAKALHGGSFVWADSTENADFSTLRPDQFLIRAAGGVGIGTNDPQQELEVAGSVRMAGFDLPTGAAAGYVLTSDAMGQGSWQPAPGGSAWGLAGNAGTNPVNDFVGTTDNVALELRVNNARAFTLLPHATSPNVVGGHSTNSVNANAWGQTVVGGGEAGGANQVTDTYGSVGGGVGNVAGNSDGSPTNASYATVAGGEGNTAFNEWAFVGGGMDNRAQGSYSVVSGGTGNTTLIQYATIGGGVNNQVTGTTGVVGGGLANEAGNNYTTVGGGAGNVASGIYSTVGGGTNITASGERATVSGGSSNLATGRAASVGGGEGNQASERGGTVGGGWNNRVFSVLGTIAGGGRSNLNDGATGNRVTDNYGTIGGGGNNQAGNGESLITDAQGATIAGGLNNLADAAQSTVGGGNGNSASGGNATVAGGASNNALASGATVGGGGSNLADETNATVAGGLQNQANGEYSTVGGGIQNQANGSGAVAGGGSNNAVDGWYATIPGGANNSAASNFSFAAGRRAKVDAAHTGAFLYADGNDFDFNSAANHEFAVRAIGGVRFVSAIDGTGTPTAGVELPSGSGTWASLSDRNAKENFVPVDGVDVLEAVAAMEISAWNYKTQDEQIRHIGPMAQDFYAAFGVGEDEKRISTVDADGVALAAIQGLKHIADKKDARIAELERRIAELEKLVALLASKNGGGVGMVSDKAASAE